MLWDVKWDSLGVTNCEHFSRKISTSDLRNSVSLSKVLQWEKGWRKYQWHDSTPRDLVSEREGVASNSQRTAVSSCLLVLLCDPHSSCQHPGYSTDTSGFPKPLSVRQFRKAPPTQACAIISNTYALKHFNQKTLSALTFRSLTLWLKSEKKKYYISYVKSKKKWYKWTYKAERDSQTWRTNLWLQRGG